MNILQVISRSLLTPSLPLEAAQCRARKRGSSMLLSEGTDDFTGFTLNGKVGTEAADAADSRARDQISIAQEQVASPVGRKPIFAQQRPRPGAPRGLNRAAKQPESRPSRFSAPLFSKAVHTFAQQDEWPQREEQLPSRSPAHVKDASGLGQASGMEKAAQANARQISEASKQQLPSQKDSYACGASSSTAQEVAPKASPSGADGASEPSFGLPKQPRHARAGFGGNAFGGKSPPDQKYRQAPGELSEAGQLRAKFSGFTVGTEQTQGKGHPFSKCELPKAGVITPRRSQPADAKHKFDLKKLAALQIRSAKKGKLRNTA